MTCHSLEPFKSAAFTFDKKKMCILCRRKREVDLQIDHSGMEAYLALLNLFLISVPHLC